MTSLPLQEASNAAQEEPLNSRKFCSSGRNFERDKESIVVNTVPPDGSIAPQLCEAEKAWLLYLSRPGSVRTRMNTTRTEVTKHHSAMIEHWR